MTSSSPVVLLGCGRLGSSIVEGWLLSGAVRPSDLVILTHSISPAAEAAQKAGARINPPLEALGDAATLVLAIKPAVWRAAVAPLVDILPATVTILSVMAGVGASSMGDALPGRPLVRVMPTTAVAQARGVAAIWSDDPSARAVGHALFDPVADTVDLTDEAHIDPATAVAGSAPAFIYAFVQALAEAGAAKGLNREAAVRLARGALRSAGAGAESGQSLEDLVARIASPGGTTEAGLNAQRDAGVARAATAAVDGAVARARALAAS